MMKNFLRSVAAMAIISWSGAVLAEVAVIVHPSAGFDSLTADEISRLFLGKSKSFPNGSPAITRNQGFYRCVVTAVFGWRAFSSNQRQVG